MHSSMDLWKAATVIPLKICRSGVLLQRNAWLCSLFAELSQSPHKCNGGRIKFLLRDELLLLTLLGLHH